MTQVEFLESEGEIPPEFLTVEYQLFRADLYALMGKPPAQPVTKTTDNARSAHVHTSAHALSVLIALLGCRPMLVVFPCTLLTEQLQRSAEALCRYYAPEPGQHPCVHRVKLTEVQAPLGSPRAPTAPSMLITLLEAQQAIMSRHAHQEAFTLKLPGLDRQHAHMQEEAADMDVEMEQYEAEIPECGGWPAARDDTIYL